jgi:POT family proton-dependent oligopeptide transporter
VASLIAIGHLLLGIEGGGGQDAFALNAFWTALAFIIVGTGFLKANISAIVGQLYPRDDVRRDPAYTIFYMGINLGGIAGADCLRLCLGETVGWSYGFGAAAVGNAARHHRVRDRQAAAARPGRECAPGEALSAKLIGPVSQSSG